MSRFNEPARETENDAKKPIHAASDSAGNVTISELLRAKGRTSVLASQGIPWNKGRIFGAIGLNPAWYGIDSLRRKTVALFWNNTGYLQTIQILLGHSKLEIAIRSLGGYINDAISMAKAASL